MIDESIDTEKIHIIDGTYGIYKGEAHKIDIDNSGDLYAYPILLIAAVAAEIYFLHVKK